MRAARAIVWVVLVASACALGACGGRASVRLGGSEPHRPTAHSDTASHVHGRAHTHDGVCCLASGRAQGARSDLIFANPAVSQRLASSGEGPEVSRRDEDLGVRPNRALVALDSWPEPARASLDNPRYGRFTPERSNTFVYYGTDRGGYRGGSGYQGSGGVWWEHGVGRDWWAPRHGW